MTDKLKPCPFCGGEAQVAMPQLTIQSLNTTFNIDTYCVYCPKCQMYFGYTPKHKGIYDTEQEAIKAWNRRV